MPGKITVIAADNLQIGERVFDVFVSLLEGFPFFPKQIDALLFLFKGGKEAYNEIKRIIMIGVFSEEKANSPDKYTRVRKYQGCFLIPFSSFPAQFSCDKTGEREKQDLSVFFKMRYFLNYEVKMLPVKDVYGHIEEGYTLDGGEDRIFFLQHGFDTSWDDFCDRT